MRLRFFSRTMLSPWWCAVLVASAGLSWIGVAAAPVAGAPGAFRWSLAGAVVLALALAAAGYAVARRVRSTEAPAPCRLLFEAHPLPMWVYNLRTLRFLHVNDAAVATYGYTRDEFEALTLFDLRPETERARLRANLAAPRQPSEQSGPWIHRTKDGTSLVVEIWSHLLPSADIFGTPALGHTSGETSGQAVLVIALDVTAREQALANLREREELLTSITHNVEEGIFRLTGERIVYANRSLARMMGYETPEAIMNVSPERLCPSLADHGPLRQQVLRDDRRREEVELHRRDGSTFWALTSLRTVRDDDGTFLWIDGAVIDLSEQYERERTLRAAKDEAETLNHLKSAFLANVSHEVRTPLTAIIGFGEILRDEVNEVHTEMAEMVREAGVRLMATLDDVLNLAKLESGTVTIQRRCVDVGALMESVLTEVRPQALAADVTLTYDAPPASPVTLRTDPSGVRQVARQLIDIGIACTPPDGRVEAGVRAEDGVVFLTVANRDTRIDAASQQHLLDASLHGTTPQRAPDGTDLGLGIVRRYLDLLGGSIAVESKTGEGTTLTVRLPPLPASRA